MLPVVMSSLNGFLAVPAAALIFEAGHCGNDRHVGIERRDKSQPIYPVLALPLRLALMGQRC
jgi:hypothetical protein